MVTKRTTEKLAKIEKRLADVRANLPNPDTFNLDALPLSVKMELLELVEAGRPMQHPPSADDLARLRQRIDVKDVLPLVSPEARAALESLL
jgi:hypothetical protein